MTTLVHASATELLQMSWSTMQDMHSKLATNRIQLKAK